MEHALLLTSSGFVYSMGFNTFSQLGGEQHMAPNAYNSDAEIQPNAVQEAQPPQMVFGLLNTKVIDIKCGAYHSVALGTPRNATAANMVGQNQRGTLSFLGQHGFGSQANQVNKNKEMVFAWGCNLNNQLGLFNGGEEQPEAVPEPTLIEDLLQYSHIRKLKCTADQTIVLVDSPNTLLIFSKRDNLRDKTDKDLSSDDVEANVREDSPYQNYKQNMNDERLGNPQGRGGGFLLRNNNPNFKHIPSKVEIEQQSIYEINPPNMKENELIVDFEIISMPQRQTDLVSSDQVVFVTNYNFIYKRELDNKESLEVLYSNPQTKSLVADHYIS